MVNGLTEETMNFVVTVKTNKMSKDEKVLTDLLNKYKSIRKEMSNPKLTKKINYDKIRPYDNLIDNLQTAIHLIKNYINE